MSENINIPDQKDSTIEPNKHEHASFNIIPPRLRPFLKAPGFLPPFLDMMIHNIIETIVLFVSFEVIFSSISFGLKTDSMNSIWWIILLEVLFTYVGFGTYIHFIKTNKLMYEKCFKCLEKLYDCWCGIPWWIAVVILFPFIQIYCLSLAIKQWMSSKQQQPKLDLKNLKHAKRFWKMADDAYNVLDICVSAKQASIVVVFIQDIPLFVICCVISNIFGAVIYIFAVVLKLVMYIKHIHDVKQCTLPMAEHYYAHFGLKHVIELGAGYHPMPYTDDESERVRWEERDPVNVYDEETEKWSIMIIMAIEKDDVIKVSHIGALSVTTEGDLEQFLGENGVYKYDRWNKEAIKPLDDDQWIEFVNRMGLNPVTPSSTENDTVSDDNEIGVAGNKMILHNNNRNKDDEEELPDGWTKVFTPEGKPYYQNNMTKATQWSKPEENNQETSDKDKPSQPSTAQQVPLSVDQDVNPVSVDNTMIDVNEQESLVLSSTNDDTQVGNDQVTNDDDDESEKNGLR